MRDCSVPRAAQNALDSPRTGNERSSAAACRQRLREAPVRIGPAPAMFGIVTSPPEPAPDDTELGIIILNTGVAHRVGHFRLSVALARELAEIGHVVLRFDLSGIGDSERRDDSLLPHERAIGDLGDAVDLMQSSYGVDRVVLVGNCSGADIATIYAGKDPRVVATVLIDPSIPATSRFHKVYLRQRLSSTKAWFKALLNPRRVVNAIHGIFKPSEPAVTGAHLSDPAVREFLKDCYASMVKADDKIMLVYTGGIRDRYNYESQIFDAFPEIDFGETLSIFHLADCDHLFPLKRDRQRLTGLIKEWLSATQMRAGRPRPPHAPDETEYF